MVNKQLVDFINEARRRGFGDFKIKEALSNHGWSLEEIEKAFASLIPKDRIKNQITLFLDDELLKGLEKRAKKNLFTVPEQIDDILRRSVINQSKKKSVCDEKLDDTLVSIFSRKRTGRKGEGEVRKD